MYDLCLLYEYDFSSNFKLFTVNQFKSVEINKCFLIYFCREIEKDTSCLQDSHQDLRTTSLNLSAKHDNLCQVLATRKDKLCTLDHQFDTKKAAMEEHLTQLSQ